MNVFDRLPAHVARWFDTYFRASSVVWALQENRRPARDDLRRLGIDPRAFTTLGHG